MIKWEYTYEVQEQNETYESLVQKLNKLGEEGWEAFSINRAVFFRRPKFHKSSETPPGGSPESFLDFLMSDTRQLN